ncbi:MAG: glycoside hydrolase family 16 protein [Ilumatobacteraceae bacterium]
MTRCRRPARPSLRPVVAAFVAGALALAGMVSAPGGALAAEPSLTFSGRTWTIKTSTGLVGPGPNLFDQSNAFVDGSGYLHLRIAKLNRRWTCGEVVLQQSLGYGTYEWVLGSDVSNLDPSAVLGIFTWNNNDASYAHREIDFEASRWGNARDKTNAQWVVQPWDISGNLQRFTIGSTVPTVVRFTWTSTRVDFATLVGGNVVNSWTYTGASLPPAGGENARMNLWLYQGRAPKAPVEIVIRSFTFTAA